MWYTPGRQQVGIQGGVQAFLGPQEPHLRGLLDVDRARFLVPLSLSLSRLSTRRLMVGLTGGSFLLSPLSGLLSGLRDLHQHVIILHALFMAKLLDFCCSQCTSGLASLWTRAIDTTLQDGIVLCPCVFCFGK